MQKKLLNSHGLVKYRPLVYFNARLMVVSIALDVSISWPMSLEPTKLTRVPLKIMLIALMQLKNPQLYVQFHPLVYMAKLKIELSMATLIKKIAQSSVASNRNEFMPNYNSSSNHQSRTQPKVADLQLQEGISSSATAGQDKVGSSINPKVIMTVKEVDIKVHTLEESGSARSIAGSSDQTGFDDRKLECHAVASEDEIPLATMKIRPEAW